jgi:hypothetical protein
MPEVLASDGLYISPRFGLISHLCPCGCGEEVVLKLSLTDWQLFYDGETVSLYPSIGNWSLPCRSHYWIIENRVQWAPQWSDTRINAGRELDRRRKENQRPQSSSGLRALLRRKWF